MTKTETRVQRRGSKLHWRRKSRQKGGRSQIDPEMRQLIRRMSRENSMWGARRILSELLLLGRAAGRRAENCRLREPVAPLKGAGGATPWR